jgi:hypothetical protein
MRLARVGVNISRSFAAGMRSSEVLRAMQEKAGVGVGGVMPPRIRRHP